MIRVRRVSLWAEDRLFVEAATLSDGSVTIEGQDLRHAGYEYFFTIKAEDLELLVRALGGSDGADVLELMKARASELVHRGEMNWLNEHSIPYDFFAP